MFGQDFKVLFLIFYFMQNGRDIESEEVSLDVYLMNGNKVSVDVLTTDQSEDVFEVCYTV